MRPDSGQTTSIWMDTASVPSYPALSSSIETGVCVVGAGIAGLTTAYLLAKQGQNVIVIDDGQIGSGETSRTTAHLSNEIDDRYVEIARVHGDDCDFTRVDVCTNSPINDLMAMHTKQAPYRSYVVVARRRTHPVAVYRDDEGALHEMSAVCPHLKCIVHWNTLEKSWDCPCHGSRFDAYGKVFTGPAVSSLEPVAAEEKSSGRG